MTMKIYLKSLFITAILVIFTISSVELFAEETKSDVSISGKLVNSITLNPIVGATIRVEGTNKGAVSRSDGSFEIKGLEPGKYAVKFSAVGYETFVNPTVVVSNVKAYQMEVKMNEVTVELEGVEVKGSFFIKQSETVTSTQTLGAEEIRNSPGIQNDVIRAAALLPGVAVSSPGRNDLVVRGGADFENLFVIDNLEIPNINHFGSQGSSGGPLSIVNIDFVNNVTFSSGGFGAKYGDKTSSITNLSFRKGNMDKLGGKAVISASQFGAHLEGPLGKNSSFIINARRSYLDLIFKAANFAFIPEYWDFFAKVNLELDKENYINIVGIGTLDNVFLNNSDSENQYKNSQIAVPDQKQYVMGITWRHLFGNGFSDITFGRTYTDFRTFQNDSLGSKIFQNYSNEGENKINADFEFQLSPLWNINFGNQLKFASTLDYDVLVPGYLRTDQNGVPQGLTVDSSFTAMKNSTYASATASLGSYRITFGGRLDYFSFTTNKLFLSPRLSVIYQLNEVSAIIFSAGRYYQSPSYIWLIGDPSNKLTAFRADQAVLGYEHTPLEDVKVQIEGYYKFYNDYPARVYRPQAVLAPAGFEDIYADIPFGLEPISNVGQGWSRGVELLIQKRFRPEFPLYGLMSLTWSQSRFTSIEGKERLSRFDSPFILNITLGYRLGADWEFSYKYRTAIGNPTTPYLSTGQLDYTRYNEGERLPIYHATDIRIDKRWHFGNFSLDTYIDVQNVFGTNNTTGTRWDQRTGTVEYNTTIGILPSIGIEFEF